MLAAFLLPYRPTRQPKVGTDREQPMRFGAGIILGMVIGAIVIIWIIVQVFQAVL